jgi:CRP-like cAMP-binding protein
LLLHQDVLESAAVLKGLTAGQMAELEPVCSERHYAAGEFILREGDPDPTLYVLVDGRAQLTKSTSFSGDRVRMIEFAAGDVLGELKIVDPQPNSASVVAVTDLTAVAIDLVGFADSAALTDVRAVVVGNVGQILARRLRATTSQGADALQRELEESRARAYAGRFIVLMFAMLATYQLGVTALELIPPTKRPPSSILSFAMIIWAAIPIALSLIRTPFSLESYGLTTRRAWRVALQAFVWTTPILLFLLILKLALMRWEPWMVGRTVLDPGAIFVNRGVSFSSFFCFTLSSISSIRHFRNLSRARACRARFSISLPCHPGGSTGKRLLFPT